jgi:large conductance mechanosensitive channel
MAVAKKGMIQEFKEFIATGDLIKIAVAFIIGGAIATVVTSFVKNIAMGIVGLFVKCTDIIGGDGKPTGEKNCSGLVGKGWRSVKWGDFLNDVVGFLIIALVIFLLVKAYRKMVPEKVEEAGPSETDLLKEIRDSLRARG